MTLHDLSDAIAKKVRKTQTIVDPDKNLVFRNLYNGLCRILGEDRCFDDVIREAERAEREGRNGETDQRVYGRAFRKVWNWYQEHYPKEKGSRNNGIDRSVRGTENWREEMERFRTPLYYRTFLDYVRNGKPLTNAEGYSFLLHVSVAFLLPPDVVDPMLVAYGFMPLHVKDLFHVAIYVVLSGRQERAQFETSPFEELAQYYAEELAILAREEEDGLLPFEGETEAFASGSTRVIQQYLSKSELTKANMLRFIDRHRTVVRRRHTRLVAEHRYLVELFSELYMRNEIDELTDRNDEACYSFYSFLREFCREDKTNRDTFRNEIYWKVAKQGHHPTRSSMILLWLFAFSFLYLPEVDAEMWEGTVRDYAALSPFGAEDERPFAPYVSRGRLQVLRYLSSETARGAPLKGFCDADGDSAVFYGGDLIRFLNKKLDDYSWRPLDVRSPFDLIVKSLEKLDFEIVSDKDGQRVRSVAYDGEALDPMKVPAVENVPYLLVFVTELLRAVKADLKGRPPLEHRCSEIV